MDDEKNRAIIVFGPPGCGKSRNADKVASLYGYDKVVDEWDFRTHKLIDGAVHFQTMSMSMKSADREESGYDDLKEKYEGLAHIWPWDIVNSDRISDLEEPEVSPIPLKPELLPQLQGFDYGETFASFGFEVTPAVFGCNEEYLLNAYKDRTPLFVNPEKVGDDPPLSLYLKAAFDRNDLQLLNSVSVVFSIKTQYDVAFELLLAATKYGLHVIPDRDFGKPDPVVAMECRMVPEADLFVSDDDKDTTRDYFDAMVNGMKTNAVEGFEEIVNRGVDMKVARRILPMGMFNTRMTVAGTLLSWFQYADATVLSDTLYEHRLVADAIRYELRLKYPTVTRLYQNPSPAVLY